MEAEGRYSGRIDSDSCQVRLERPDIYIETPSRQPGRAFDRRPGVISASVRGDRGQHRRHRIRRFMARGGVRIDRDRLSVASGVHDRTTDHLAHGPADRQCREQKERNDADGPTYSGTHVPSIPLLVPDDSPCGGAEHPPTAVAHSTARLRRSELPITDTELKLMAAAAIIGLSSSPNTGYSTPAAIGTPSEL